MINAQAQPSYTNNYKSKDTNVNLNKIKCINDNININGENAGDVNAGNKGQGYLGTSSSGNDDEYGNGEGYYNDGYGNNNNNKQGKGFDDCVINNNNTNNNNIVIVGEEPTIPGSLTVKKEIFGCDNISQRPIHIMNCDLQNNSPDWLSCDHLNISNTIFCQALPENFFDIEVLDEQDTQIQEFEGSQQGTTIQNLEPGTYTVNEIRHATPNNQLQASPIHAQECIDHGFAGGGILVNTNPASFTSYTICFEYEDEQGNDCTTTTIAAGEEKTCIVKNYIRLGATTQI